MVGGRGQRGRQQVPCKEGQEITLGNMVTAWVAIRAALNDRVSEGEPWNLHEPLQTKLSGLVTLVEDVV